MDSVVASPVKSRGSHSARVTSVHYMSSCHLGHCDRVSVTEHSVHGIPLCERCHALVERFGHPRTLGDLSNLVSLAVLGFGAAKVRAALTRLEEID